MKKAGFAVGGPLAFQGVPLRMMANHKPLQRLASQSTNDNVIVIVQLHGGNDGINTFIPLEQYDLYNSRRANIAIPYQVGTRTAIPLDSTVPFADQVGLHPDMVDFKHMYDTGRAAVYQGVSYENNNGSHFRGRDIWFMGGGSDDYYSSGWVGRYLNAEFAPLTYPADFPNNDMPDPLALEMGNDLSLIFHQTGNIPTSLSLGASPDQVANTIANLEGFVDQGLDPRGLPPAFLEGSPYNAEMDWILGLEDKSETYIERLSEIYQAAAESKVDYPDLYPFNAPQGARNNPLSNQLRLAARLLGGGVKTKVILVRMGGFDSHAQQAETYDATMGTHAALLYHLSSAIRAFHEDLATRGLANRVLTMTMSEFGRRIESNGSYGTDHGTGGPVMMFGSGVNPGIFGTNPNMEDSNVGMQLDYRQLYANVLHEWMGVEQEVIADDIFFRDFISGPNPSGGSFEPLDVIRDEILSTEQFRPDFFKIEGVYPNPAVSSTSVKIFVNDVQTVTVSLVDTSGKTMHNWKKKLAPGTHQLTLDLSAFAPDIYFLKAESEKLNDTKKLIITD